ncbi:phosphoribosylamine--glycine ligase [Methanocaldococcus villosus KIN24-T80]|uniref:Phosphoribosylamine--glycine ligase n=1 Tax=Methanocaldococcus villosus KIN24-T80 TaxID=1069083 RepID=N6VY23_9EURY|nr:phosphoribosylamine--glycine ligase [Methanocaldococcus villosus]ENN96027.1 phosphoribosylamine--glycine ligase [Methanocaldococcus villosus KIN24-T80]
MKVLLIGGGARESAIAHALKRGDVELYTLMKNKNPGIAKLSEEIKIAKETDLNAIEEFAKKTNPDLAIIGPEAPLEKGAVDLLESLSIPTVGPSKEAAKIETDKSFMRNLMKKYGIKGSLLYKTFDSYGEDLISFIDELTEKGIKAVVKPVGLTGGKGVKVVGEQLKDNEEAKKYAKEIFEKSIGGGRVIIEEKLEGVEFTLHGFVDSDNIAFTPFVQDHPHALEGDKGSITGGMGSYSCPDHKLPFLTDEDVEEAKEIMSETVKALKEEVGGYKGILYGQFMLTKEGPKIIEYNARFGDPEAMNILAILKNNFIDVCEGIVNRSLNKMNVEFENKATVCKYIAPKGYPDDPVKGFIEVDEGKIKEVGAILHYASVDERDGKLYMTGSRALAVVGVADTIEEAERIAEEATKYVRGEVYHRSDVGKKELIKKRIEKMRKLRQLS